MNFKSYEDLRKVANGELVSKGKDGKDSTVWKTQHEYFGTHLANKPDVESLSETSAVMIAKCKLWITNWETVQEGIKPELDVIRTKQLDAIAEKYVGYSEEQLQALWGRIRQKKGLAPEA